MNSEGDLRVLSVGTDVGVATKSVKWNEDYNIKDYDWIFLNYYSLDQQVGDSTVSELLNGFVKPGQSDIFRSVATGSKVVALLPERNKIPRDRHTRMDISGHFPNDFSLINESGESLQPDTVPTRWEWYFDRSFNWKVYIRGRAGEYEYRGSRFEYRNKSLASNKANELLACVSNFQEVIETSSGYQNEKNELPGEISFIPVIRDYNPENLIKEILDEFTDLDARIKAENSPGWVDEKSLPGENEKVSELSDLKDQKRKIEEEIAQKNEELQELGRYKALLWGNEDALEQLVPEVFREFGFDVEGEQPHGRDGMIFHDNKRYVMEITGTTGGISDDKCRQLSAWVDDLELEDQENDYIGLLVVNPDRKTRPGERNPDEYLPPHLRRFLEKRGYHVLLTPKLYDLLGKYRSSRIDYGDICDILDKDDLVI